MRCFPVRDSRGPLLALSAGILSPMSGKRRRSLVETRLTRSRTALSEAAFAFLEHDTFQASVHVAALYRLDCDGVTLREKGQTGPVDPVVVCVQGVVDDVCPRDSCCTTSGALCGVKCRCAELSFSKAKVQCQLECFGSWCFIVSEGFVMCVYVSL